MHKNFTLKNGKTVLVRQIESADAVAMVEYIDKFSKTSIYTRQYSGQPKKDVEKTKANLENPNQIHIGVFDADEIVAMAMLNISHPDHPWVGREASFGIHMLPDYRGQSLGKFLMQLLEKTAHQKNIHRIEGGVRTQNHAGIILYLKSGFIIEGTHKHKAFIDGVWHDEYSIAKILD